VPSIIQATDLAADVGQVLLAVLNDDVRLPGLVPGVVQAAALRLGVEVDLLVDDLDVAALRHVPDVLQRPALAGGLVEPGLVLLHLVDDAEVAAAGDMFDVVEAADF